MIASGIRQVTIEAAAAQVGVRAEVTSLSGSGLRHRVKVYPIEPRGNGPYGAPHSTHTASGRRRKGERGDYSYQRTKRDGSGARVHAVCWHGFRDFFRACFEREPDATFRTSLDTWRGSADFEARFRASGHRNIGSQFAPVGAAEACRCGEEGIAA